MDGFLKKRGKNKEADPKFIIKTADGLMEVKRFFVICSRPRKVVALCHVTEGEVFSGDSLKMISFDKEKTLGSIVSRIERDKKKIEYAVKNENIGICLKEITIRQLREFNNSISVVVLA